MVGRGGRSKGCDSCRQRHLKCDQATPSCQRCKRDNFECQYPAPKFINAFQKPVTKRKEVARQCSIVPPPIGTEMVQTMSVTLLRRTIFATSAEANAWPGFEALALRESDLALKCLLALSETYFGAVQRVPDVAQRGRQQYIECLSSVHTSLALFGSRPHSEVVLAVTILGAYEMLFMTTDSGWVNHALGLGRIFQLAGPEICADKTCFRVFSNTRYLMILAALCMGTPTFVAEPEWLDIPWRISGAKRRDMDKLLDIYVDVPALRIAHRDGGYPDGTTAFAGAMSILARMQSWFGEWQQHSFPTERVPLPFPTLPHEQPVPKPWATDFQHVSIPASNCFGVYNAAKIFVTQAALLSAQPGDLRPGDAAALLTGAREAGLNICRSIDYELLHTTGTVGQLTVLVPMEKAYEILGRGATPEGRWLESRHAYIRAQTGTWEVSQQTLRRRNMPDEVPYLTNEVV